MNQDEPKWDLNPDLLNVPTPNLSDLFYNEKDPDSYGAMLDRGLKELREKISNPEIPDNLKGKE